MKDISDENTQTYSYTYDKAGNIETISKNGELLNKYYYDGANRLTREDNYTAYRTYTWTYDVGGNITEKKECWLNDLGDVYNVIPYTYGNEWKDQLTSFNGQSFQYDSLGNPTVYRGKCLTWGNVRRLMSYSDCDGCNTTFKYNADGIRISKNYINYLLDGTKIIEESDGVRTIKYLYGEGGIIGFNYENTDYYYRKNIQGDILEIYTSTGTKVASYVYDAWGKVLEVNEHTNSGIGNLNPFRYRSYYYDVETGLYYLNSRYYDPETGRFINSDGIDYLTVDDVSGLNAYIYCSDNPIMRCDPLGRNWLKNAWNSFVNFLGDTFGAGASVSSQKTIYKKELIPTYYPITASTGVVETVFDASYGDSSKPISVYANGESTNYVLSSSAGLKINIGKFTLNASWALDNMGITGSWNNGNTIESFGIVRDLTSLSVKAKYSSTTENNTSYIEGGVSIWLIFAVAYAVQTGDVSQFSRTKAYAY